MNDNVRKYLGYAAGEIVLVIVGILIALQIDAWYEEKQIRTNLNAQLRSVADSISQDLVGVAKLKRHRVDSIIRTNILFDMTNDADNPESWYTRDYVEFASQLIATSQVPVYFVPSTGAFQALESSGIANQIRDPLLKRNLNDYYATVERIAFAERELNNVIREVGLKYATETTRGLGSLLLQEPLIAWEPDNLLTGSAETAAMFRASYLRLILDAVTQTLLRTNRNQPLLKEYEHLLSLGHILVDQLEAYITDDRRAFSSNTVFHADSRVGPATVIRAGRFEAHSLGMFDAPPEGMFGNRVGDRYLANDYFGVNYRGGEDWAFFYVAAGPIDINMGKYSLDYSRFDRIRLELRRDTGCDDLQLVLKDAEDADDGSQATVRLKLSGEWEWYEYPLSLFTDADLTQLNVVAGFLMYQDACSFAIRDIVYLEPGET